jgi:F-type H+-transporting ATPase subunit gamma
LATLQDIRKRIGSVKNTQKITKAMKMVAAAKLRRSQQSLVAARPYARQMSQLVSHLAEGGEDSPGGAQQEAPRHPLLMPRDEPKILRLVVLTSDRGFCGGFNGTLLRQVCDRLPGLQEKYEKVDLRVIGRKGRDFFNARGIAVDDLETGVYENFDFSDARQRADQLAADYEQAAWDECIFVYNRFKSAINQEVTFKQMVPIQADDGAQQAAPLNAEYVPDYIYEPLAPKLLADLLPRYLATELYRIFLESIASEFGARMVAMDAATGNCSDMIEGLTLKANRLRQAVITNELMDIVNGAEALR